MADQDFRVELSFRDEATGRFKKATQEMIDSMKRAGLVVDKTGKAMVLNMDKMAEATKKSNYEFKRMRGVTGGLRADIGALRNAILVFMFVLRPLINQTKMMVQAAEAQERAETKLKLALRGSGLATQEQTEGLMSYARELQATTTVGDEQIINAQAMLATFKLNSEQIRQATPRVLDMARAITQLTGKEADLQQISIAVGKGLTGQIGILSRYGVVIPDSVKKSKDFNQILKALDSNFKGMSEAQMNFTDQLKSTINVQSDLREELGRIAIESPVVIASMKIVSDSLREQTDRMRESRKETKNYVAAWAYTATFFIAFTNTLRTIWRMWYEGVRRIAAGIFLILEALTRQHSEMIQSIRTNIANWLDSLANIYDKIGKFIPKFKEWADGMREAAESTRSFADEHINRLNETKKILGETADEILKGNIAIADVIVIGVNDAIDSYAKLISTTMDVDKAQQQQLNNLKTGIKTLEEHFAEFGVKVEDEMKRIAQGMHRAMSDFFFDAATGELKRLQDYFAQFGKVVIRVLTDVFAKMLIIKMLPWAGPFLGVPTGHKGGVVSHYGIRNFHRGGEVPAMLLEGEGVVSQQGMRTLGTENLSKINRGESITSEPSIIINQVIQAWDATDVYRNRKVLSAAIIDDLRRNASIRGAIRQYG